MKITNVKNLKTFLLKKGYHIIPLTLTRTNHFELTAHLNGIQGRFIVDTGASSTCVGLDCIKHFNLIPELSEIKASGAGATNMETQISKKNILEIGPWQKKKVELVLLISPMLIKHSHKMMLSQSTVSLEQMFLKNPRLSLIIPKKDYILNSLYYFLKYILILTFIDKAYND